MKHLATSRWFQGPSQNIDFVDNNQLIMSSSVSRYVQIDSFVSINTDITEANISILSLFMDYLTRKNYATSALGRK